MGQFGWETPREDPRIGKVQAIEKEDKIIDGSFQISIRSARRSIENDENMCWTQWLWLDELVSRTEVRGCPWPSILYVADTRSNRRRDRLVATIRISR